MQLQFDEENPSEPLNPSEKPETLSPSSLVDAEEEEEDNDDDEDREGGIGCGGGGSDVVELVFFLFSLVW